MKSPSAVPVSIPSAPLLGHFRGLVQRWLPFAGMADAHVDWFLSHACQRYLEPGEVLLQPEQGVVRELYLIRQGTVRCEQGPQGTQTTGFAYEPGEMLPVAALLSQRPVTSTYIAADDVFVLVIPAADVETLIQRSPPFADFLNRRVQSLLDRSRQALSETYASRALAEQSLETPLAQIARQEPVHCLPDTPLRTALATMHERHVGSMLVIDAQGQLSGILTRHDLLGLVVQKGLNLDVPICAVMNSPVHALAHDCSAQDAALLMSRHAIRHVPVTRDGRVIGIVSERDLFALQRASLQQVSARIHRATDTASLILAAQEIRELARSLLGQGVQSRQLTTLISHLNDLLVRRLVSLEAAAAGIDLAQICWVALGSEGRGEQTIATDQDNALIVPDDLADDAVQALRDWAHRLNHALDACGYPLCKGGIMAGQPACCMRLSGWLARFDHWIEHGSPQDLLQASTFFDLRCVAGNESMAAALSARIGQRVAQTPRFLHQLAVNALAHRSPLNWLGRVELDEHGAMDLKLQGTALFVDAARILGLAHGVSATGTRERLAQAGMALGLEPREYESWITAFEFLQSLRLRVQLEPEVARGEHPNQLMLATLSDIDRRILATSLRMARSLQQRLELDYAR